LTRLAARASNSKIEIPLDKKESTTRDRIGKDD
jgi:hypothetical protein